ncbi:hypothetical protein M440DRAFT_1464596 [Trichoderma longibrachiatum ATCC 18648]|uniref:NAD(P)-binding protein n=1 Tax=Trichoderma longibrachiatum ATCC 18648 TaxID=983965 RepID=A0A2T4BWZ2_TRILO|nr:hypothetical protein M440DRAFT_1464596 [Trichoderma longibrachiatum ATCC 18648]
MVGRGSSAAVEAARTGICKRPLLSEFTSLDRISKGVQGMECKAVADQQDLSLNLAFSTALSPLNMINKLLHGPSFISGAARGKDANQYASEHIRINAICPGYTMTPIMGDVGPEIQHALDEGMHRTAMKRFAQPEELANSITYLSLWMSSFMSGEAMLVDGGFSS